MTYRIFDADKGQWASVACFFTIEQAQRQIIKWQDRQAKGKRPDVDCSNLKPIRIR